MMAYIYTELVWCEFLQELVHDQQAYPLKTYETFNQYKRKLLCLLNADTVYYIVSEAIHVAKKRNRSLRFAG